MNKYLFLVLCFSLLQCTHEKALPIHNLTLSKQIEDVADTLLLHDVTCLTFHDNKLFFTNPVYDHIVSLDKNLDLLKIIGTQGEGPGQLLSISQFAIDDSLISVLNGRNRRINVFSVAGDPVSETAISSSILFDLNYRYCFIDADIIGCSPAAETPLSKYNIYTKEQTLFGEIYQFPTSKQTEIRNRRFMVKMDTRLIVVSDNLPSIEIYDQDNLERISLYDYSGIGQIEKNIQAIESKSGITDNSYCVLIQDVYVTDRHLYVLLNDFTNNDFKANQIIKFDIHPDIKPVALYKLPGDYFSTFCVDEEDGVVYAYHHTENMLGAYLELTPDYWR